MKVVILAAGMGLRLGRQTEKIPKCLISVNGKTILDRMVQNCLSIGVNDFVCVVGHGKHSMLKKIAELGSNYSIKITAKENTEYRVTNTGVSLAIALRDIDEDALIINGDNIFDRGILQGLLKSTMTAIVVDRHKVLTDESFKLRINGNFIGRMGKNVPIDQATGEFIGISLIRRDDLGLFKRILSDLIRNRNVYYDFAFQELSTIGRVSFVFTDGHQWTEVDNYDDLVLASKVVKELDATS